MRHKVIALFLGLCMVLSAVSQADAGAKEVLSVIPGDIMGTVFIPSPKQLDADYQKIVDKLGLAMFAPPSLINLVKMQIARATGDGRFRCACHCRVAGGKLHGTAKQTGPDRSHHVR